MTDSRPFPMHVPTLTEVVEELPVTEAPAADQAPTTPVMADMGGGVSLGSPPADVPVLDEVVLADEPLAVLTVAVVSSEVLPPVEALLDAPDLSDSGRMVAAAESGALTPELADQLTDQITANMTSAMAPVIEGLAQQIVQQMQEEFAQRLRAMVSQAVVQELNKRRL